MAQRGAQPGNSNAVKHGFYSRHFRVLERRDLAAIQAAGLTDEIAMLRVATRRLFALMTKGKDPELNLKYLHALSSASSTIGNLVRVQAIVGLDEKNELNMTIKTILLELTQRESE